MLSVVQAAPSALLASKSSQKTAPAGHPAAPPSPEPIEASGATPPVDELLPATSLLLPVAVPPLNGELVPPTVTLVEPPYAEDVDVVLEVVPLSTAGLDVAEPPPLPPELHSVRPARAIPSPRQRRPRRSAG
jgi:hypothetical protein